MKAHYLCLIFLKNLNYKKIDVNVEKVEELIEKYSIDLFIYNTFKFKNIYI